MMNTTTSTGCPTWCNSPAEPFDPLTDEPGTFVRSHELELGFVQDNDGARVVLLLSADDRLTISDAGVQLVDGRPRITLVTEGVQLTASQARQLADNLYTAAHMLDKATTEGAES